MLNLAPAVGYTHPDRGYLIDICSGETGVPITLENLIHNGYADATAVTVSIGPGENETHGVHCGLCGYGGLGIKHVSDTELACRACREFRFLTAL